MDGEESRTLSSARTSPTAGFAQAALQSQDYEYGGRGRAGEGGEYNAHAHATANVNNNVNVNVNVDLLSGTTPKCNAGFWQARYSNINSSSN